MHTTNSISSLDDLIKKECESLRSFLMKDFDADRPMPESAYEREKRTLHRYPLSADEIQEQRKKAALRCGV